MLPDRAIPEQWRTFLHQCLANRIDIDEFTDLSGLMFSRSPVKENELLDLLLEARASSSVTWDPLLPLYVDGLCKVGRVKSSSALASLLKHSSVLDGSGSGEGEGEGQSSPPKSKKQKPSTLMTDIKVIQDVMVFISTGSIPKTVIEAANIYSATVDWILAVVAWHNNSMGASQHTGGLMGSPDAVSLFESLGILLAALSGTSKGLEVLSSDYNQGKSTWSPLGDDTTISVEGLLTISARVENEIGTGFVKLSASLYRCLSAASTSPRRVAESVPSLSWSAF
jgi:mediator of RNA polymerase II transcription subunit 5